LSAHTFAHLKDGFSPLKSMFGYDDRLGYFDPSRSGIVAKRFRDSSVPSFGHMAASDRLGHDIFTFAYLGVHNPYHRQGDDPPIKPFGLFLKKDVEQFCFCHGSPCDVVESNERVDQGELKYYYLEPESLRELKAMEIAGAADIPDAWYNYGNPDAWRSIKNYGKELFKRQGEFRYYKRIAPDAVAAILWPSGFDHVDDDDIPTTAEEQELLRAFLQAYPDIDVVHYSHNDGYQHNWAIQLVEASYWTARYFVQYQTFPMNATLAMNALN